MILVIHIWISVGPTLCYISPQRNIVGRCAPPSFGISKNHHNPPMPSPLVRIAVIPTVWFWNDWKKSVFIPLLFIIISSSIIISINISSKSVLFYLSNGVSKGGYGQDSLVRKKFSGRFALKLVIKVPFRSSGASEREWKRSSGPPAKANEKAPRATQLGPAPQQEGMKKHLKLLSQPLRVVAPRAEGGRYIRPDKADAKTWKLLSYPVIYMLIWGSNADIMMVIWG